MSLYQKRPVIIFSILILIAAALSIAIWKQPENQNPVESTTQINIADEQTSLPLYHELVDSDDDGKVIKNTKCELIFKIPADWSVDGLFGGTKILSPADIRRNKEWNEAHEEELQNTEGETNGLDGRSLSISCQDSVKNYLADFSMSPYYKIFKNTKHLVDSFATDAFHAKDSNLALLKTIKIDGEAAYEISWTVDMPDGSSNTTYELLVEKNKVYQIHLGQTEYDNLSDEVKQIIQSITFEE